MARKTMAIRRQKEWPDITPQRGFTGNKSRNSGSIGGSYSFARQKYVDLYNYLLFLVFRYAKNTNPSKH